MNYPPPPVPAPMSPPPPPPRKSSALKWILIGCGGAAFLGILACGGCFLVGFLVVKGAMNEAIATVRPIVAENETVKAEIGDIQELNPVWSGFSAEKRNGRQTIHCKLEVKGSKGKGTVDVRLTSDESNDDEALVELTFVSAAGKRTPLGTWRAYDDGKGNSGFEPVGNEAGGGEPETND